MPLEIIMENYQKTLILILSIKDRKYNFWPKPIWIWNEHRNTKGRMSETNTYKEHLLYNENERNAKNIDIVTYAIFLTRRNILWTHAAHAKIYGPTPPTPSKPKF